MKTLLYSLVFIITYTTTPLAQATPAADTLLQKYKSEGVLKFEIERGRQAWHKEVKNVNGEMLSCATCHGNDLTKQGKHRTTQKIIEPMAISVNPERYTDEKKIEKWLKRNCHDVWGRECTAQEKGDILKYLLSL